MEKVPSRKRVISVGVDQADSSGIFPWEICKKSLITLLFVLTWAVFEI
jgi:hypothetical protein